MKGKAIYIIITLLAFYSCNSGYFQSKQVNNKNFPEKNEDDRFRFMFYNVENLFDTFDDSLKNDDEFLPDKAKFWTKSKYYTKLEHIYQVIVAVGGWELPDAIGLSEIENKLVLEELIEKTPLYRFNYKIIHYESPDPRGIDVAFLYKPDKFEPIHSHPIKITFPESSSGTRDILYVCGTTHNGDTLHFFINHWPSRWGGQMETEDKRMYCATVVKQKTDSILAVNAHANIIITGDLNDYPTDKSMLISLNTETTFDKITPKKLYNLSYYLQEEKHTGSHKHDGHWGVLDQIVVSGALLDKNNSIYTTVDDIHVFDGAFLLENDEKNTGQTPFRTYIGYKYHGGYSDHLPTYVDLYKK